MTNLAMWTVYDHPTDYPDEFVARKFVVGCGTIDATPELLTADTLNELRAKLPIGFICTRRMPDDDPKIVEVWL